MASGKPFLGICVGMQLIADARLEFERDARASAGSTATSRRSGPPIRRSRFRTWAGTRSAIGEHPLLDGIPLGPDGLHAYFVHSYPSACRRPGRRLAEADYGGR